MLTKNKTAPVDSAGVTFDPAIHQAFKNGTPRKTKDGRYFTKSRVDIAKARKRAVAKTNPPRPTVIPATAPVEGHDGPVTGAERPPEEVATAPATAPETPPLTAPVEHGPAQVADIISEFPTPTVTPGEPEPEPPAPDGPAPTKSTVAAEPPDAAAQAIAEAGNLGTAKFVTAMIEVGACAGIDAEEWKMKPAERAMIEVAVKDVLDETGAIQLTPKQRLAIALGTYAAPRAAMPKTRAKIMKVYDWVLGLMGRRRKDVPSIISDAVNIVTNGHDAHFDPKGVNAERPAA